MYKFIFKKVKLSGYTLLEMMTVIGIFAIMGTFMFAGMPDIAKYIRFQKDALLFSDTVRDLQVRGVSAYSTSTLQETLDSDRIIDDLVTSGKIRSEDRRRYKVVSEQVITPLGYGMYIDLSQGAATDSFIIFSDFMDSDILSEDKKNFGLLSSNTIYDADTEFLRTEKLAYSLIDKIYVTDPDDPNNKVEFKKASVVFLRSKITPYIMYFDHENLSDPWKKTKNLYIQLYSPSLPEIESYKCIAVQESGQTFTSGEKCD